MKKIKTMLMLVIFSVVMLIPLCCFASDYNADFADLSEYFGLKDHWNVKKGNISVENDILTLAECEGTVANTSQKFLNEVLHFNMTSDFCEENKNIMFLLRAKKESGLPWGSDANDCILYVIKKDRIELQMFSSGTGNMIACVPNPVLDWTNVDVEIGAVNVGEEVSAFLRLNGKTVLLKTNPSFVANEGYFEIITASKCELKAAEENKGFVLPINITVEPNYDDESFYVKYDKVNVGETEKLSDFEYEWAVSEENLSLLNVSEPTDINALTDVEYRNSNDNEISEQDNGRYIFAVLNDGVSDYFSAEYYVEYAKILVKKGIFMMDDWYIATVDGEQKMLDEDTTQICPIFGADYVLIPLRFVVENMNGSVEWDESTKSVMINLMQKNALLQCKENTIGDSENESVITVRLKDGRTFVDAKGFAEFYGLKFFANMNNKIVALNRECNVADESVLNGIKKVIMYGE